MRTRIWFNKPSTTSKSRFDTETTHLSTHKLNLPQLNELKEGREEISHLIFTNNKGFIIKYTVIFK